MEKSCSSDPRSSLNFILFLPTSFPLTRGKFWYQTLVITAKEVVGNHAERHGKKAKLIYHVIFCISQLTEQLFSCLQSLIHWGLIFWKYYENILKIFWKYLKYSKFRLEARFWVVSKGKNDSHDPLRPVALKYIKYFHHIFKYFHSIFIVFSNVFKIFQSYAKYSRKWQFCLILLPFPRGSDQLYCCFIQVFGIKLSLSLRGIKI